MAKKEKEDNKTEKKSGGTAPKKTTTRKKTTSGEGQGQQAQGGNQSEDMEEQFPGWMNRISKTARGYLTDPEKGKELIERGFSKVTGIEDTDEAKKEFKYQIQLFMRMMREYFMGRYRKMPTQSLLKILGAIVYFVLLVDLVPDFIPALGFVDDAAVIAWVFSSLQSDLEDFEDWEDDREKKQKAKKAKTA